MKTRHLLLSFSLLTMVFFSACTVEKVNIDNANALAENAYVIKGKVVSATDILPVPGAVVYIGRVETLTDANGEYTLELTQAPLPDELLRVRAANYASSLQRVPASFETKANLMYNFILTPNGPTYPGSPSDRTVSPTSDITVVIPERSWNPLTSTLTITRLSERQASGIFPMDDNKFYKPFFTLDLAAFPSGTRLVRTISISVATSSLPALSDDVDVALLRLNEETGQYELVATSTFAQGVNGGTFNFSVPEFGRWALAQVGTLISDQYIKTTLIDGIASNCDCGPTDLFSLGYKWMVADSVSGKLMNETFVGLGLTPPDFGLATMDFPTQTILSPVQDSLTIEFIQEKCRRQFYTVENVLRIAEGSIDGMDFRVVRQEGVTLNVGGIVPCEIGTDCHQGTCPETN